MDDVPEWLRNGETGPPEGPDPSTDPNSVREKKNLDKQLITKT